ncbi:cytochrome o ubiquinol oxidase operon protein cyoD [Pseudomonas moraviensis]|uniref:hypothetical protein n=1 Tax=Pseudomonas moraviensis TaxID=321662 RepID=UPI003D1C77D5
MNISTSPYNQSPIHSSAGTSHGTSRSYMVGFIISVILTVIPFGLVMYPTSPRSVTAWVVVLLVGLSLWIMGSIHHNMLAH